MVVDRCIKMEHGRYDGGHHDPIDTEGNFC